MFGFLIKKTFFDMWDNMFRIILLNLAFIGVLGLVALPSLVSGEVPDQAAIAGGAPGTARAAAAPEPQAPAAPMSEAEAQAGFQKFIEDCVAKPFTAPWRASSSCSARSAGRS